MQGIIFHIDMNSYFATVEQQANPHLRGRPVGVCEHLGGIIIAASVEAKMLGIGTGTPVWEARKIYPKIVLLKVDPPKVRFITERFLKIFSDYTDLVERYSIDEAFLDFGIKTKILKDTCHPGLDPGSTRARKDPDCNQDDSTIWSDAILVALEIKQRIRREIGEWLTCSVGIGPNKLIAKIASNLQKPDGLTVVRPQDIEELYDKLSLTDIPGINVRMQARLSAHGIYTVKDLSRYPESKLRAEFGLVGHYLKQLGNFKSTRGIVLPGDEPVKSMGHAFTMSRASSDVREIEALIFKLSEKVARRLRQRNMWGSVVSCYVRFAKEKVPFSQRREPSQNFGRSHRIKDFINDGRLISREAIKIFNSSGIKAPVRMIGISVSGLVENFLDEPLFRRYKKSQWALDAMDKVNDKYGEFTLRRAALLDAKHLAGDTVGFGRLAR
ncbi:MAG: hypothetical protein COT91_04255 [Candidatus Doudnabacteria bacterium CG10_big_fil_rev_8_21_14_0_10_41_10]|uniref:DNA polymerase IV n=1 Tax=Candidatus Doudnabacteria bacterium CG10_big_fil_rev_8_21_14_0_10_41_10 TaxID=1974551 RepID=A0A2H0VCV4_9BACT|nr:MAG: hypothetical protein COT91_04255 [Candidatus Doudnabacteria bacterium CG10_big_fil_rev_8_21_14_0_10_41_10]